jgi:polysaccharide export outer membrane protein
MSTLQRFRCLIYLVTLTGSVWNAGCQAPQQRHDSQAGATAAQANVQAQAPLPRELNKAVLPTYIIEPPDILVIDAIQMVPRAPYHLHTLDLLSIQVQNTIPDAPIAGNYSIEPGGSVNLGPRYGMSVPVAGLTVEEAEQAIARHLSAYLKQPLVSLTLADVGGRQLITGQHLVKPDGTVTLGIYGSVRVVGLTIAQAKLAVEQHLSQYLENPEVSLDVFAYNSKFYYIVTQGAGLGDGVYRFVVTGNETVLDAISQINGLQQVSSKKIWIARPTDDPCQIQMLPVKWEDITAHASACTNYQIMPGDRVFIAEDQLIALDTGLAKLTAPLERIMGFSLLGVGTATRFSGSVLKGGGNPNGTF